MPFLVEAQGLSRATVGTLLTLVVLSNMAVGLVYGQVIARHHAARLPLALGTVGATALLWAVTLAYPAEHAPMWLLVVLCTVLGACGPASMIGFDFARPHESGGAAGDGVRDHEHGGLRGVDDHAVRGGGAAGRDGGRLHRRVLLGVRVAGARCHADSAVAQAAALRERERLVASRVETVHVPV